MRIATTLAGCLLLCSPALAQHRPHDAHLPNGTTTSKPKGPKTILTPTEAARLLRVKVGTVNRLFDQGQLRGFRVPGSRFRRIPRKNLEAFARRHRIRLAGPTITKPKGYVSGLPTPIGPDGKPWVCFDCSCSPCMCGLPPGKTKPAAQADEKPKDGARQRIDGLLGDRKRRRLRRRGKPTDPAEQRQADRTPNEQTTPAKPTPLERLKKLRDGLRRGADASLDASLERLKKIRDGLRRGADASLDRAKKVGTAVGKGVKAGADASLERLKAIRDSLLGKKPAPQRGAPGAR